jgi:hypothetical protein
MQPQTFVVSDAFEITDHGSDFNAVGMQLQQFITARTWPIFEKAVEIAREVGAPKRCLCEFENGYEELFGVVLTIESRHDGGFGIVAREAVNIPAAIELARMYRVLLLEPGEVAATVEHETHCREEAVAWLEEWLTNPLGKIPAIVPPRE